MGWLRIERVTWAERALWAVLVAGSIAPTALRPGAEQLALAYVEAIDRGDVDAALEVTARDFVMRDVLGGYVYGLAVRDALEYRAGNPKVTMVFVMRDGQLVLERVRTGARDAGRDLRPFLRWAAAERPRELAAVWVEGHPVRSAAAVGRLLELLRT
ncbi:hypothetical protein BH20GEM1_BH20GEM1_13830 [soil metagenome]